MSFPYDPVSIPVRTISLCPFKTNVLASLITTSSGLDLTFPLAYGITQYEQKFVQPSSIFKKALV